MALLKIGSCNHCGKCCKPPVMLENPMISRGDSACRFYDEDLTVHCRVLRGEITLTPEQQKWFNDNCVDYPSIKEIERGYAPPPECSIKVVEVA